MFEMTNNDDSFVYACTVMEKGNLAHEQPSSTGWGALFFVHTAEDVSAAAVTPPSPSTRPSLVFSSKGDSGSPLEKLQSQHQRILKEPSRLFESMVVAGLHPSCDIQALKRQYFGRRPEGPGRLRSALSGQHQFRVEPNLEPQVLFVYPPDKQLPLRSKDLLSFCFPDEHHFRKVDSLSVDQGDTDCVIPVRPEIETDSPKKECVAAESVADICDSHVDYNVSNKQSSHEHILNAILPLLRYQQYDSSDSSSSFHGSPSEDRNFRSDVDSADTEEAPFSGQEGTSKMIFLIGLRGLTIKFHPLEHLHPLEFHRPDETILHMTGSTVDLMSCNTSFELAEAHRAFALEEEATALSVWAISCLLAPCVLIMFASEAFQKISAKNKKNRSFNKVPPAVGSLLVARRVYKKKRKGKEVTAIGMYEIAHYSKKTHKMVNEEAEKVLNELRIEEANSTLTPAEICLKQLKHIPGHIKGRSASTRNIFDSTAELTEVESRGISIGKNLQAREEEAIADRELGDWGNIEKVVSSKVLLLGLHDEPMNGKTVSLKESMTSNKNTGSSWIETSIPFVLQDHTNENTRICREIQAISESVQQNALPFTQLQKIGHLFVHVSRSGLGLALPSIVTLGDGVDRVIGVSSEFGVQEMLNGTTENVKLSRSSSVTERATDEHHFRKVDSLSVDQGDTDCVILVHPEIETDSPKKECVAAESVADICDSRVDYNVSNKQPSHEHILNAILPLLRYQQYDSSDSSSR
ncbi:DENN (AEX-3) domain-containing protein [Tanacetum coccineum]|uniref:DENN (AEX-3) domain-containing protein n=1 Tax=Tanacetum coccineum TaxID=301880 RepID=A0ABQ5HHA7_9ASTR